MHGSQLYCLQSTAARITPGCDLSSLTNHVYVHAAQGQGGSLCTFQLMNWGVHGKGRTVDAGPVLVSGGQSPSLLLLSGHLALL